MIMCISVQLLNFGLCNANLLASARLTVLFAFVKDTFSKPPEDVKL